MKNQRSRWEAIRRTNGRAPAEIVDKIEYWIVTRQRPRWYHYVHRWWLTVALPYRDWKLPWR